MRGFLSLFSCIAGSWQGAATYVGGRSLPAGASCYTPGVYTKRSVVDVCGSSAKAKAQQHMQELEGNLLVGRWPLLVA